MEYGEDDIRLRPATNIPRLSDFAARRDFESAEVDRRQIFVKRLAPALDKALAEQAAERRAAELAFAQQDIDAEFDNYVVEAHETTMNEVDREFDEAVAALLEDAEKPEEEVITTEDAIAYGNGENRVIDMRDGSGGSSISSDESSGPRRVITSRTSEIPDQPGEWGSPTTELKTAIATLTRDPIEVEVENTEEDEIHVLTEPKDDVDIFEPRTATKIEVVIPPEPTKQPSQVKRFWKLLKNTVEKLIKPRNLAFLGALAISAIVVPNYLGGDPAEEALKAEPAATEIVEEDDKEVPASTTSSTSTTAPKPPLTAEQAAIVVTPEFATFYEISQTMTPEQALQTLDYAATLIALENQS